MKKQRLLLFIMTLFLSVAIGCTGAVEFENEDPSTPGGGDGGDGSDPIVNATHTLSPMGSGIANGTTLLYVIVRAFDENGDPNEGFQPFLDVGSDASFKTCTSTDSCGLAMCSLTSLSAGTKTVTLSNIEDPVSVDVEFSAGAVNNSFVSNVAGSGISTVVGGYKITASVSGIGGPARFEDPVTGYVVYSTSQGILSSEFDGLSETVTNE